MAVVAKQHTETAQSVQSKQKQSDCMLLHMVVVVEESSDRAEEEESRPYRARWRCGSEGAT